MAKPATRRFPYLRFREAFYLLVEMIGLIYFSAFFFFDHRLPAARYVLGITRVLSLYFIFMLIDASRHHDGRILVKMKGGKKIFSLELEEEPEAIAKMDLVTFRVEDDTSQD